MPSSLPRERERQTLSAYESIYTHDTVADSAQQAAELAATATKLSGDWTVIHGTPVTVTIAEVRAFHAEAKSPAP